MGMASYYGVTIVSLGAVPPLIDLLKGIPDDIKVAASLALCNLAAYDNRLTIGAIPRLYALLSADSDYVKKHAEQVLTELTMCDIPPYIARLSGPDDVKAQAAWALANLALNDDNCVTIASAGAILPLIALLSGPDEMGKKQAARALANLALNDDNRATIASAGAIPPLIALLRGPDEVKVHAACALANLAINRDNRATTRRLFDAGERAHEVLRRQKAQGWRDGEVIVGAEGLCRALA